MPKEYNWKTILFGALPLSIVMFFVFNSSLKRNTKFFLLVIGALAASGITYYFDKKKHNIFTSGFLVALVGLIFHGLIRLDFI